MVGIIQATFLRWEPNSLEALYRYCIRSLGSPAAWAFDHHGTIHKEAFQAFYWCWEERRAGFSAWVGRPVLHAGSQDHRNRVS